MSKIYYRYGTMNSAKTMNLLTAVHSYEETNRKCLLLKPALDTRDKNVIKSRAGLVKKCITFEKEQNLISLVLNHLALIKYNNKNLDAIFIDEVQFCTEDQILQLVKISMNFDIPILCYGLKSDYTGNLFPAISKLMVYADRIEEIKTVCAFCDKKAIMNLRVVNGDPVYEGDNIKIENINNVNDRYVQTCKKHYFNPKI